LLSGIRYEYGFAANTGQIIDEWLIAYPRRIAQHWFQREWDGKKHTIRFGSHLKGEKLRIHEMTRADALFLSVAAQFNQAQLMPIYQWINNRIIVQQAPLVSPSFTAEAIESSEPASRAIAQFLRDADVGIGRVLVRRHKQIPRHDDTSAELHSPKEFI